MPVTESQVLKSGTVQNQPTQQQIDAVTELETVVRLQNRDLVETAVFQALASGLHPLHSQPLIILVEAPWHSRHEDIARALQQLRSPVAVDALERTAHAVHEYLAYDDSFALARKCAWALADIGTPEAKRALRRLAACDNSIIASYAQKRLTNWQNELHRKRLSVSC
jgi:hypothetical protein